MNKIFPSLVFGLLVASLTYGQTIPSTEPLGTQSTNTYHSNLSRYLDEHQWDDLFPHRYGKGLKDTINQLPDFYSLQAFESAANLFPNFLSEGDAILQNRELAAFLANAAQETSGGWPAAPGGYLAWGLYFLEETGQGHSNDYNDTTKKSYPGVPGQYYYGRGPKQLTWNFNYGQFSQAWYGSKDTLLTHPDLLSRDPVLSFASAIWFWMTPQFPKPSCHDIMTGKWQPTDHDTQQGRMAGFGATVNVINGGVECGSGSDIPKTKNRYDYFRYFCQYFGVSPGGNVTCTNQQPFGQ